MDARNMPCKRDGTQKPEWTKPFTAPAIFLVAMMMVICPVVNWK
jgi:hypothetical protein